MQVGDLVICNCSADTWYKGIPGILAGFDACTRDPMVAYGNGMLLRLAKSVLEVVSASR